MKRLVAIGLLAVAPSLLLHGQTRPLRLTKPRIQPLAKELWTDDDRALAKMYAHDGGADNDFRTFLNNSETVKGVMPFLTYISDDSSLLPREREILILRSAWLCQNDYIWAHHVVAAKRAGLTNAYIRRITQGPEMYGWAPFDVTLIQATDELFKNGFISTPTWKALTAKYDTTHVIDAVFTITGTIMYADTFNSIGVELEPGFTERLPGDVIYEINVPAPEPLPAAPRIPPVDFATASPETKAMLDPTGSGRGPTAVFRTVAQNAKLYPPQQLVSEYTRRPGMKLSAHVQQLLILRAAWLSNSAYQFSQHIRMGREAGLDMSRIVTGADAPGWDPIDAALIRATDEWHRDDIVSDATWNILAAKYNVGEMMDVLITMGAYRMIALATRTFGVALEPDAEGFPTSSPRPQ